MKTKVKRESYQLANENCLEILPRIPDNSVDMVLTSPPYDELREYGSSFEVWDSGVWKPCLLEIARLLKEGGVCVWVVSDSVKKGSESGTSFRQALWAKECGLGLETMIWEKTGSGCLGSKYFYNQIFEYMFVFTKGFPKTTNFIKDRKNKIGEGSVKTTGGIGSDGRGVQRHVQLSPFGKRSNIWWIHQEKKSEHPAAFPFKLAKDHIITWSNKNDIVLDPFMGSGTSGCAAGYNGRRFIGIELESGYFEIAREQIERVYRMWR